MKENIFKMYGIAGGISYGNIIWTYATDKAENWINNSSSLAIYDQISWQIIQGIHLIAKYDFFDPNLKLQNGAISRYTLGTEIYPLSILEIKIQLRLNKVHSKSNLKKDPEYLIQTHLYF